MTDEADGELVEFGPPPPEGWPSLTLPRSFTRAIVDTNYPDLRFTVMCEFDGSNRVRLTTWSLSNVSAAGSLTANDLNGGLGFDLYGLVHSAAQDAQRVASGAPLVAPPAHASLESGPTPGNLAIASRIYIFEFVAWGKPRAAIMEYFGIARATANSWLKQARTVYDLPIGPFRGASES